LSGWLPNQIDNKLSFEKRNTFSFGVHSQPSRDVQTNNITSSEY